MTILVCFGGTPIFGTPHIYIHIVLYFLCLKTFSWISFPFLRKKWFSRLAGASADALHLVKISVGIARDEAVWDSPFFFKGIFYGSSMKTGGFTIGDPLKFPLSLVFLMFFCFEMIWQPQKTKVLERKRPGGWKEKASPKKVAAFWAIL